MKVITIKDNAMDFNEDGTLMANWVMNGITKMVNFMDFNDHGTVMANSIMKIIT